MDNTVHGILQVRILEWIALPLSGDLPNPGIQPRSPALQVDSLPTEPSGKTTSIYKLVKIEIYKNDLNLNENSKCLSVEYPVCLWIIGALKHLYYAW